MSDIITEIITVTDGDNGSVNVTIDPTVPTTNIPAELVNQYKPVVGSEFIQITGEDGVVKVTVAPPAIVLAPAVVFTQVDMTTGIISLVDGKPVRFQGVVYTSADQFSAATFTGADILTGIWEVQQ